MDGVLASIYPQLIKFEFEASGKRIHAEDMIGRNEEEVFPNFHAHLHTDGFFETAPVIPGSQEVLEALNEQYEVFIVSAAMEFPKSLSEKQNWLNRHFPFISWKQMIFCGLKTPIQGDIMIDDMFKNLDHFKGRGILFTQPHNQLLDPKNNTRVHHWSDIKSLLLG